MSMKNEMTYFIENFNINIDLDLKFFQKVSLFKFITNKIGMKNICKTIFNLNKNLKSGNFEFQIFIEEISKTNLISQQEISLFLEKLKKNNGIDFNNQNAFSFNQNQENNTDPSLIKSNKRLFSFEYSPNFNQNSSKQITQKIQLENIKDTPEISQEFSFN